MIAPVFCVDSIAAVFKGSLDPAPLGTCSMLVRWLVLVMLQLFAKLEVSSFTRSKYMQAVPEFKNSAPGPDHALFAGILSCVR